MDISKKELLEETGISYGQLYRWKREGLIPEEWFEKRSSFTGQETYFPREAILKRIEMIQQLKDMYSLEDLAKMLDPEMSSQEFNEEDFEHIKELHVDVVASFMDVMEKDTFTFREVILMIALSKCIEEGNIENSALSSLTKQLIVLQSKVQGFEYMLTFIHCEQAYYPMFLQENATLFMDEHLHVVYEVSLTELSSSIKLKYQNKFRFD